MKICIVGPAYPYRGGLASIMETMARVYQSAGHEVTIYTFTVQYPSLLFPGKTQYVTTPPPSGLRIERVLNNVNPLSWIRLGLRLRREAPDIVLMKVIQYFFDNSTSTKGADGSSMLHSVISSEYASYLIPIGILFAFILTVICTGKLAEFLPKDAGREFAHDGKLSAGKPRGAGIIFVLSFMLAALLFAPVQPEQIIYLLLVGVSMMTGYLDDASKMPWSR